jgi:hypothetical protein
MGPAVLPAMSSLASQFAKANPTALHVSLAPSGTDIVWYKYAKKKGKITYT